MIGLTQVNKVNFCDKNSNKKEENTRNRHSEPEEYKDIDDLLGGPKDVNINKNPNLVSRNSHTQNIKPPAKEKDAFEGIDFSKF